MMTIAFLGGGIDAVKIIQRAKDMGLRTIVVDRDPECPGSELADVFHEASCYHVDETLDALRGHGFDGVLCAGTDAPLVQAIVAAEYGLVGPMPQQGHISSDKFVQAVTLGNAGVRVPPWSLRSEFVQETEGPWVCKPTDSRGARGVVRFSDPDRWLDMYNIAAKASPTGRVVFQKWIDGIQLSSESIVLYGAVQWTGLSERNYARLEEFAPYVIEDGGDLPIEWHGRRGVVEEAVDVAIQSCVDALEYRQGTIKGDLVWDGKKIWVIEVALRLSGGEFCSRQIPLAYGVDFVKEAIEIALGEFQDVVFCDDFLSSVHVCQRFRFHGNPRSHPERGPGVIATGATRYEAREKAQEMLRAMDEG